MDNQKNNQTHKPVEDARENSERVTPEDFHPQLKLLLEETIKNKATDLHLSTGRHPILRVDSHLVSIKSRPVLTGESVRQLTMSVLNKQQEARFWQEKDIDLSFSYGEGRFRSNIYQQMGKVSAAFRLLPHKIRNIKELFLPEAIYQFTKISQGFFLVVGPSGHGKSTALAAMIDEINHHRADHVITIEDPIEYVFEQDKCIIDQREVGLDVLNFPRGLRSAFREDADVIMIGEMRDAETIGTAVTAAETGHLIFATLHTNTAAQTIDRIIDTFPPHQQHQIRLQLAATLLGILSRRLLPAKKGGLINAVELLIANPAVRNLIREGKVYQIDMVIETGAEEGMISLNRSLVDLIKSDLITIETAQVYSLNPAELLMMLKK